MIRAGCEPRCFSAHFDFSCLEPGLQDILFTFVDRLLSLQTTFSQKVQPNTVQTNLYAIQQGPTSAQVRARQRAPVVEGELSGHRGSFDILGMKICSVFIRPVFLPAPLYQNCSSQTHLPSPTFPPRHPVHFVTLSAAASMQARQQLSQQSTAA